jgi:hypothetical protein
MSWQAVSADIIPNIFPKNRKLGLVWIKRKKISQIINDYLYLPFFLLIILWCEPCACAAG